VSRHTPTSRALKILIPAADILIVALLILGGLSLTLGAYRFFVLGIRVSVPSPVRPWLFAAILLALRVWLSPHLPAGLRDSATRPLPLDEARLFGAAPFGRRATELALVCVGFVLLVAAFTWPQVRHMDSAPDMGDPLFSIWRIAWVNHQVWRHPFALFDANIFYPERLTLTYSDAVIVPALTSAPLFWLGLPEAVTYNLLFFSGFVLSGVCTYYLVRALTGRREAAVVAGVLFALHPYRLEHYSHLELQMTMWMPLTLWGLHRAMASGRLRDGLATGLGYALQMLSSLYYGLFFAVYLVVVGAALWIGRRFPMQPLGVLAAGALLAGVMIAPVASQYIADKPMMGERQVSTVAFYSATGADYLTPHFRNAVYERWSHNGHPERQLFPRIAPVALAVVGVWPPLSVARIGYAAALAVTFDGSLGTNGFVFPWLRNHVPGFAGLRVPARFSLLVGLTLAILGGYGAARILGRWPRAHGLLTAVMIGAIAIEAVPNITLKRIWPRPPAIYDAIANDPGAVLAEFPMTSNIGGGWIDTPYLYFSTFHWHKMVNGNSGFFPPSYEELQIKEKDFPSDEAVSYLRARGVTHIALHGAFTNSTRYHHTADVLEARGDMELIAVAPWEGSESRLYHFRR